MTPNGKNMHLHNTNGIILINYHNGDKSFQNLFRITFLKDNFISNFSNINDKQIYSDLKAIYIYVRPLHNIFIIYY